MQTSRGNFRPSRRPLATLATGLVVATTGVGAFAASSLADHGGASRLDGDQSSAVKKAVDGNRADNVILLVGDGMGDSEITAAATTGRRRRPVPGLDALPLTGQCTTYSLDKDGKPDYVTDPPPRAARATGTKTHNSANTVDIAGKAQRTLLARAKKKGYKTGDVTTSELQDATPAVQVAHISARSCYGPVATTSNCPEAALENGGPGSITEQLLKTRPDVTLGGGAKTFDEKATAGQYANLTLLDQAQRRGYQAGGRRRSLEAVTKADQRSPLLGFSPSATCRCAAGPAASATGGAGEP